MQDLAISYGGFQLPSNGTSGGSLPPAFFSDLADQWDPVMHLA